MSISRSPQVLLYPQATGNIRQETIDWGYLTGEVALVHQETIDWGYLTGEALQNKTEEPLVSTN